MMDVKKLFASLFITSFCFGDNVTFTRPPLARFKVEGLVDISDLGSWNGEPVTEENQPNEYQRRLSCWIDFFGVPNQWPYEMYLRVSDVVSTQGAYWSGTSFYNTLLTRIKVDFEVENTDIVEVGFNDANPNQAVLGNGEPPVPVSQTLGWTHTNNTLHTEDPWQYAFAEFGYVYGGVVQEGGGLFRLRLNSNYNEISWSESTITCVYGLENQEIVATFTPDLNGDGLVGFVDLAQVLSSIGTPCDDCAEDIDNDGVVKFEDLLMIINSWG